MDTATLVKRPAESRVYTMDFAVNMSLGEAITGVVSYVAAPATLTLSGAATFSGTKVFQRIEGGDDGEVYEITVRVTTSGGNTLQGEGYLRVKS